MTVFWPALLTGVVVVLAGAALVRHRERVARATSDLQQQTFGDGAMVRRVRAKNTGRTTGRVGVGWMVLGAVMIVLSVLGLDW